MLLRIDFTPFWPAYLMLGPHHQIVDYTCVSTIMSSRYRIIVGTRLAPYLTALSSNGNFYDVHCWLALCIPICVVILRVSYKYTYWSMKILCKPH